MQGRVLRLITGRRTINDYFDYKYIESNKKGMKGIVAVLAFLFLMMLILLIACYDEPHTVVIVSVLMSILGIEAGFFIYIVISYNRYPKYGNILNEDHDGSISLTRISEMTGYPVHTVRSDITRGIRQNIFSNTKIEGDYVILGSDSASDDFTDVICPTCGASNRLRRGSADKCEHCGSYLRRR